MPYKCSICGKEHDQVMDLAFQKPEDYFRVPERLRNWKIKLTSDLCTIDNRVFLIRGVLPIPVMDNPQGFRWGVWAAVDKASFRRYKELWNVDGTNEPTFAGTLANVFPIYPETYGLELDVQLHTAKERPSYHLRPSDHLLYAEQKDGITMARVHEILETAMPDVYKKP
jgi:hypothetical protein